MAKGWKKGKKQTKEHIQKRIESRKLRNPEWHSQATKDKMSATRQGVPKSEETKKKMAKAKEGKRHNIYTKMHMSISHQKRDYAIKQKRAKEQKKGGEPDLFDVASNIRKQKGAIDKKKRYNRLFGL